MSATTGEAEQTSRDFKKPCCGDSTQAELLTSCKGNAPVPNRTEPNRTEPTQAPFKSLFIHQQKRQQKSAPSAVLDCLFPLSCQ